MVGAKDADEMSVPQLQSAINRHFRNFSERQKDFKKIERKSVDAKVETLRRQIEPSVVQMIRRSFSEPSEGSGVLMKLRLAPKQTRAQQPMERTVQVGIARPLVTEDPGTSDMYMNWRPGNMDDHKMGALVALPLTLSTAKKIGGISMDGQELIAAANNYGLRTAMEKTEMDNEELDTAEVIVVDQDAYEARVQYHEPMRRKEAVGKNRAMVLAMTEKLEESYSPGETRTGAFTKSRMAKLANSTNFANREISFRSTFSTSTSFDKSLEKRDFGYRQTIIDERFPLERKRGM